MERDINILSKRTDDDIKTVLSIAGSDSCGGAGIQADIKTCCALKVYATTAITALTAQNTLGVKGIEYTAPDFVKAQIKAVAEDIRPNAVKIGMLGNADIARAVADAVAELGLINVVLDPVLVASSGSSLSGETEETVKVILEKLAPLATIITPNIPEMGTLLGFPLDFEDAATFPLRLMGMTGCKAVLLKGGHGDHEMATDYLTYRDADGELHFREFSAPRIKTSNNHGTGCTLSSAIACYLAKGEPLDVAVEKGKNFVTEALKGSVTRKIGTGTGPLDFFVGV